MSLTGLATKDVQISRFVPGQTSPIGETLPASWAAPVTYPGVAYLEQTGATEVTVGQDVQTADWLLVLDDPTIELSGRDRVTVGNIVFEVVGPPSHPRDHHTEARLRVVE